MNLSPKNSKAHLNVGSCDSVVCVVRTLGAGRARYQRSTPVIYNKIYLFSKVSSLVLVPTQTPTKQAPRPIFLGVKQPECEADISLSSRDEV
jgi:hypothetical protein